MQRRNVRFDTDVLSDRAQLSVCGFLYLWILSVWVPLSVGPSVMNSWMRLQMQTAGVRFVFEVR